MNTHSVRILSATIDVPLDIAYDFAHRPENFPQWAAGLSETLRKSERGWVASTPEGEALVRFSERNEFGVLDHWVLLEEDRPEIYIPLRMVANGDGTEIELVLFRQPEMTDADFERDAGSVGKDLASLKALLESNSYRIEHP